MRYPLYPIVDQALIDVNLLFGVDIKKRRFPTAEDREIANRYDVNAALEKALRQRKEVGLDT